MIDVKKILEKEGQVRKLEGNAPDGFILVHEKTLEDLLDFLKKILTRHKKLKPNLRVD
jgi:hypothetical protein